MGTKKVDLPYWPRLMRLRMAAAYLSLSPERFKAIVPVAGLKIGSTVLWDRAAIDVWVDALGGRGEIDVRKHWLDKLKG